MIDLLLDDDRLITPSCIEPTEDGRGTKISVAREHDNNTSRVISQYPIPIRASALRAAMREAFTAGEPWLSVMAADIPVLNAKYDPSRPQDPVAKAGRFLGFGGS